mgnify:CR=1 FL=1
MGLVSVVYLPVATAVTAYPVLGPDLPEVAWSEECIGARVGESTGQWAGLVAVAVQMPFRGSIVGLSYRANAAKTAGTANFTAYVETEPQTNTVLDWTNGLVRDYLTFSEGIYPFNAGEDVSVLVTTNSSFSPTTIEVAATLYATFTP